MLSTSQRSFSFLILSLLVCSNQSIASHQTYFSERLNSYTESTKTFPKKESEAQTILGVCAAAACVVGAVVLGGIVLSNWFNVSDESLLRDCDNRYHAIKDAYWPMLQRYVSNDDLENHIIDRFLNATYRVLAYKKQLEADIKKMSDDRKAVAHRVRELSKKLASYHQDNTFNHTLARATKRSLELLYNDQTVLLEQLRALLVRVVRLPRCQKEEKEKRKDQREYERLNALSRPQVVHVHNDCLHGCHENSLHVHVR